MNFTLNVAVMIKIEVDEFLEQMHEQHLLSIKSSLNSRFKGETVYGYFGWFENDRHRQGNRTVKVDRVEMNGSEPVLIDENNRLVHFYPNSPVRIFES